MRYADQNSFAKWNCSGFSSALNLRPTPKWRCTVSCPLLAFASLSPRNSQGPDSKVFRQLVTGHFSLGWERSESAAGVMTWQGDSWLTETASTTQYRAPADELTEGTWLYGQMDSIALQFIMPCLFSTVTRCLYVGLLVGNTNAYLSKG